MMGFTMWLMNAMLCWVACGVRAPVPERPDPPPHYVSDYFVFVAADTAESLVVPIDVNWEPRPDGRIFTELKAWRGTLEQWPMLYHVGTADLPGSAAFPKRWQDIPEVGGFRFGDGRVSAASDTLGALSLSVPPESEGVSTTRTPEPGMSIRYTAFRTSLTDGGRAVAGWLIHERVDLDRLVKTEASPLPFERYHWMPVVAPDALYLFNHDGERAHNAVRWRIGDAKRTVDSTDAFAFEVTGHEAEAVSGRSNVPNAWQITAPEWGVSFTLESRAGHTGHGAERPGGKALYRQATLVGTDADNRPLVGMLELILED